MTTETVSDIVNRFRPDLGGFEALYQWLHKNAELSRLETQTAQQMANHLTGLGFAVTMGVGGTGVVGVFRNGEGRCVMLRAELDALQIREDTNLPYACSKLMDDMHGRREQPVMHAAGHDLHMASMLAAATLMKEAVSHWQGTLVIVFQPNKVHAKGAQAMVDGGLYTVSPVPDAIFAQHSGPYRAGHISFVHGPALMSWDTVEIKLYCSLGYRANPQANTNPVALAFNLIDALETLAKHYHNCAVITVKEVHAGTPGQDSVSHVDLILDIKTDDEALLQVILKAIFPKAKEVCRAAGVKQSPRVETFARAPLTMNDARLAGFVQQSFGRHFGGDRVRAGTPLPSMVCDDIPRLAEPHGTPYVVWHLGRQRPPNADPYDFGKLIREAPFNESPLNAPAIRPTLQTGTDALALAALSFLFRSRTRTSEEEATTYGQGVTAYEEGDMTYDEDIVSEEGDTAYEEDSEYIVSEQEDAAYEEDLTPVR